MKSKASNSNALETAKATANSTVPVILGVNCKNKDIKNMKTLISIIIFTFLSTNIMASDATEQEKVISKKESPKQTIIKSAPLKNQQKVPQDKEHKISKKQIELQKDKTEIIKIENPIGAIATIITIAIPLIVLLVSNFVTLYKIRIESKFAIKNELKMNSINIKRDQLSLFYDPIIALTNTNSSVFTSFGPRTFPEDMHKGEEAKCIWGNFISSVIIPNNKEIVKIIKSYSHLMHPEENFDLYLNFMKHAASYEIFRQTPNEIHSDFSYPSEFLPTVKGYREVILTELRALENQINS